MPGLTVGDKKTPGVAIATIGTQRSKYIFLNDNPGNNSVIEAPDVFPIPIISDKNTNRVAIMGPSGCGKTYFACRFIERIMATNPEFCLYIFARMRDDDSFEYLRKKFDDEEKKRVFFLDLSDEKADAIETLKTDDFCDSIVLMDDISTIMHDGIRKKILKLRNDLLEIGRKNKTHVICTNHFIFDHASTRTLLNESTAIVLYPQSGNTYHPEKFFRENIGLPRDRIKQILSTSSRWIYFYKEYPLYIVYENAVEMARDNTGGGRY